MKKAVSILLSLAIIFLFSVEPIASKVNVENKILHNDSNVLVTLLEDSGKYQKIKIEDKKTMKSNI